MVSKRSTFKAKSITYPLPAAETTHSISADFPVSEFPSASLLKKKSITLDWLEALPDAALVLDESGEITHANAQAATMFGFARDDLVGKPVEMLMPERFRADHMVSRFGFLTSPRTLSPGERYEMYARRQDGVEFAVDIALSHLKIPPATLTLAVIREITERKRAELAMKESESRLRSIIGNSKDGIIFFDGNTRKIIFGNEAMAKLLGCSTEELVGRTIPSIHPSEEWEKVEQEFQKHVRGDISLSNAIPVLRNDGSVFYADISSSLMSLEGKAYYSAFFRDITERKQAEEQIRRRNEELSTLNRISLAFSHLALPSEILELLFTNIGKVLDNRNLYIALYDEESHSISFPIYSINGERETPTSRPFGNGLTEYVIRTGEPLLIKTNQLEFLEEHGIDQLGTPSRCFLAMPMQIGERVMGVIATQDYEKENVYDIYHMELLSTLAAQGAIALENARLFEETHHRMEELATMVKLSSSLRVAQTRAEMLPVILDQIINLLKADGAAIAILNPINGETMIELAGGDWSEWTGIQLQPGEGISGYVIETGQPYINNNVRNDARMASIKQLDDLRAVACVPLEAHENTIGSLWVGRRSDITANEVRLLTAISDMLANAIYRASLHEQTKEQVQHLTAMHVIDATISSSFDLHLTLDIFLDQLISQLHVDATAILLLNPHSLILEYVAQRGFRTKEIKHVRLHLGEGYAGRAGLERKTYIIPDLRNKDENYSLIPALKAEGFIAYFGIPLIAKGAVKGVLEIFHRAPHHPGPTWLEFLETLGRQAAIAIDNAQLFDDLQLSNLNLVLAYDATIRGWSNALDLRDKETEGHTERVTEMTVRLAHMLNLSDADLVNIRRGALLHDIGKMGVPDNILLKTDDLTDEEQAVMQQHPQFAYDMLSPIAYLGTALDIPYCHHEKWDGTGYPRGLKGEQIPLAARLFAVVDVWDALRSYRHYRQAWPEDKVIEYIQAGSGTHFDPKAVKLLLIALGEEASRQYKEG